MALDTSQLVSRVRQNTNRTNTTTNPDTQIIAYLNDALKVLARRHQWRDLSSVLTSDSTVVDQLEYNFPSNMKEIISLRLIDDNASRSLIQRTQTWLDILDANPDSSSATGKPEYYAINGNDYSLYPVPNEVWQLKLNMQIFPAELVNDTDEPDITDIDDVLIAAATSDLYSAIALFQEAEFWRRKFEDRLKFAIIQDNNRPALRPIHDGVYAVEEAEMHVNTLPAEYWNNPAIGL